MPLATFRAVTEPAISETKNDPALARSGAFSFLFLTLALGSGLSIAAFLLVETGERQRVEREFAWRSRSQDQTLRVNLQRLEECLYTVRDLFESSTQVTYAEFITTTTDLRQRHPGIQIIEWAPRVPGEERPAFEDQARREISPDYQILEPKTDRSGNARSGDYPEYAPVYFIDPRKGHEPALGFDCYRGTHTQAANFARDTGKIAATRRVALRPAARGEYGWAYFLPVYRIGVNLETVEDRRQAFRGYIVGVCSLHKLMEQTMPEVRQNMVEALLVDRSADEADAPLIAFQDGAPLPPPLPAESAFASGLYRSFRVDVGGRDWRIHFRPSPTWAAAQSTQYHWAVLGGGLVITALLGFVVHGTQRRAALVAHLVQERTAQLRAAEATLRGDIRRREEVEHALRESDARYRAFVSQSTEAIWRFEFSVPCPVALPVEAQIEHCCRYGVLAEGNDQMAQMYGFASSQEIVGTRLGDFLMRTASHRPTSLAAMIANGYRLANQESHEVDIHGVPKVFLNNLTGIVEDGLLKRVWGTQRDITEQKRRAEQQHEQATRLRLAVSAAHLGTWDWDLRTQRMTWSPESEQIYGLTPGTFDGRFETFLTYVHPQDREHVRAAIRRSLEMPGESAASYELRIVRPDGEIRWLVVRGAVLRDDAGTPIRRLGTVMDITAQRQAGEEKARIERKLQDSQKLESLGILAGGIAHDFNNLLTGILGNASLARLDLPSTSPAQTSLEQIELVAQRAAELCKQMLAYSGKGRFIVQRLDLSALVRDTAELLRLSISKNAVLKFSLATDLPAINADATQMRQILMNLIINASEAIGERSGVITIATGVMSADRAYLTEAHLSPAIPEGDYVFIEVSDNGSGMDAKTQSRIFDPFFTTKFTGRGLGLAAVLGIVRGHHGALKVYSEPGRGTSFKLLLPRADGPAETIPASPRTLPDWRGSGTMLVVDDEETVRAVSTRMLKNMGFSVLSASNGREALEVFRQHPNKITGVLLDLTMPQLDGTATFTELRRLQPEIRVLLMSGFNEQEAVNRFAGKGLAGFIQKPFKPEMLLDKLRAIIEPEPGREPFS